MLGAALITTGAAGQAIVTIDSGVTYQTMRGWEVTSFIASPCDPAFPALRDVGIDMAVNQIGINRLRLEVLSGVENSTDHYANWEANGCPAPPDPDYQIWRENRYATVNDNSNPNVINLSGFNFTQLDWTVENIVLPFREKMALNGEDLFVNLCYVAFTNQLSDGGYHHDDPDEYAEFVLATHLHLRDTYGFVPDTWEILLEPDNVSQWNGTLVGQAMAAAGDRVAAHGFSPRFVAPSDTNMAQAITDFDALIAVPGALQYLEEFSYHRYGGVSVANLQSIADRAVTYDLQTGMLEWWFDNATHDVLHQDLTVGRNATWQGSTLQSLFDTDTSDPLNPVVSITPIQKLIRQYFKFVRRGAIRIDATSDDAEFDPIAFINTDGGYVVVIKADAGGAVTVAGLPAGTYARKYTTDAQFDIDLTDVSINDGEFLGASIPAAGVITISRRLACANPGDFDGDGDIDDSDYANLATCLTGPGGAQPPACACADFDDNGEADLSDFARFQVNFDQP